MENNIKADLCKELRSLLDEWQALGSYISVTERDYVRIKAKISQVCTLLDALEASR